MTEKWGFFERRTEQEHLRILVDCSWSEAAPPERYTDLLSVTVNLIQVMARSGNKSSTIKQLEQLETRFEQTLTDTDSAVYVGRINTAKRLEFYYYTAKGQFISDKIEKLKQEWQEFRIAFHHSSDPEWQRYRFMLPDGLEQMLIHNAQMVYAMIHKGDHIERPRQVYHWLLFREQEHRRSMKQTALKLGYQAEEGKESELQPEYPYALVISRWDNVKLDTVNEHVRQLHPYVAELQGKYDGWGSVMRLSPLQRVSKGLKKLLGKIRHLLHK